MWSTEKSSNTGDYINFNWTEPLLSKILQSFNNSANRHYDISYQRNVDNKISYIIPPQFGVISAIICIFIFDKIFLKKVYLNKNGRYILHWPSFMSLNTFLSIFSFIFFILIFPVMSVLIIFFYIQKQMVKIVLIMKYGRKLIKMMDGTDTVWAMEEDNAKSIINVMCTVECQNYKSNNEDLLNSIKNKMLIKLNNENTMCRKLLYRKSFEYGYHFWKCISDVAIDEIIRPMNITDDETINAEYIQNFVSERSNTELPIKNTFPWEILVGTKPMYGTKLFPILFRIHHSLGDGVALLNLLLNTVGTENKQIVHRYESFRESVIYFFDMYDWRKIWNKILRYTSMMKKYLIILCLMPACLINQVLRPPDENAIHGPALSGKKIISWVSDDHSAESLLCKIKRIKSNIPGATFSELFLTALSISFQKHLNQIQSDYITPQFLTAVVPVRMGLPNQKYAATTVQLENRFSVAMLTVPMISANNSILSRLIAVRNETNELRKKSDFYVNYWLMKIGGSILPESILKPMLTSVQATLVVSNLPGPSNIIICDDYKLEKIVFFVPHRGNTGIGITIMSCNDRIHLGIMADTNLIAERQEAAAILKNIIRQLEKLDNFTSK